MEKEDNGLGVASPQVLLRLFGPLEVRIRGQIAPGIHSRKAHWLLSLLALRHGQNVERGWLAGTLWPESTEAHAYASLRQSIADLRRALGSEADCIESPNTRVLRLNIPSDSVDVTQFKARVESDNEDDLSQAILLRRGTLLEGCAEEWVLQERESLEQAYLGALEKMADIAEKRGEYGVSARYLRMIIAADPLRECAHRSLIQALAQCGDYSAAVQVYRDLRVLLHRELNTEPDPETTAQFREIRTSVRERARV